MQTQMNKYAWSTHPDFQQGWYDSMANIRKVPAQVKDLVMYNQGYAAAKKNKVIEQVEPQEVTELDFI